MLKKIIPVIKATILILTSISLPLFVGMSYVKSSMKSGSIHYIDSFTKSECTGISKYLTLQLENTQKEVEKTCSDLNAIGIQNPKAIDKILKDIVQTNNNIVSIHLYQEDGKFISGSIDGDKTDLSISDKLKKLGQNIHYELRQLKNEDIVMKLIASRTLNAGDESKKVFIAMSVKWSKFDDYMKKLTTGSFPRMMYILSPDCMRYISMNCLPAGSKHDTTVMALGLHLSSNLSRIPNGLLNIIIQSKKFRAFKSDVATPNGMTGNKFAVMVATDDSAIQALAGNMHYLSLAIVALIMIWLVLCLAMSRFHNRVKDQLEIAETITYSTPLAVVIFNAADGKIMQINLSGSSLLRISQEAIPTVNMWDIFISPDDKQYVKNAAASEINVLNYEVMIQSFGGGSFWSICSATPIKVNEKAYVVLAILDINRRKEIEKKLANNAELLEKQVAERTADLEEKAKELEGLNSLLEKAKLTADEANAAKSKFLTNMSNEFKTPVNAIMGYSEILREEALDRKDNVSADDLQKILGSAKHLLSLIDGILDLSMIEAGKTQFSFENIEISEIIKEVEGVSMPLITANDNSLFLEYPKDIGTMYVDATKLRQCLLNLLSNSAKFTEFGKVILKAAPIVKDGTDFIEFSVTDTGSGISPDNLKSIFESFQDGSENSTNTGLGLSLTKKYVECMGGSVSVDSELGVGSKFSIRIPRVCTVMSNDHIIVKNEHKEEAFDDDILEIESLGSNQDSTGAKVFALKSDNQEV